MAVNFNPSEQASGENSTLNQLMKDALRDLGELTPDTYLTLYQKKLINYANKVINEINRHPIFLDILEDQFDDIVGCSMTQGSNKITLPSSATTMLKRGAPFRITGCGFGGGTLTTFVLKDSDVANQLIAADEAETTNAAATIKPVFTGRLRLYTGVNDTRAVDDQVMIEGIKHFYTADDTNDATRISTKATQFYDRLNAWLNSVTNYFGRLDMVLRDEESFR